MAKRNAIVTPISWYAVAATALLAACQWNSGTPTVSDAHDAKADACAAAQCQACPCSDCAPVNAPAGTYCVPGGKCDGNGVCVRTIEDAAASTNDIGIGSDGTSTDGDDVHAGCKSDKDCPQISCVKSFCNPTAGQCISTDAADGTLCPSGLPPAPCGGTAVCQAGQCVPMQTKCDDGDPCTQDSCGDIGTCVHQPTVGPGCTKGCSSDAQCDDGMPCSTDKCQIGASGVGLCVHEANVALAGCCHPLTFPATCDDGDQCTFDACAADFQCKHVLAAGCGGQPCKSLTDCYDGDDCTTDFCNDGLCAYSGKVCASSDPCVLSSCDPASGQCIYQKTADCCVSDQDCNSAGPCGWGLCGKKTPYDTTGTCFYSQVSPCVLCKSVADCGAYPCLQESCVNGGCNYKVMKLACNDGNPCTTDDCSPATGTCNHAPVPGCKP